MSRVDLLYQQDYSMLKYWLGCANEEVIFSGENLRFHVRSSETSGTHPTVGRLESHTQIGAPLQ